MEVAAREGRIAETYASFLVRRRRLAGGELRIEVEHIQSGERVRVASLAEAMAWMDAQGDWSPSGGPRSREASHVGTTRVLEKGGRG